ncbi:calcium-binding protein [Tritonibacter horizontis]|uniref:Hemolysin, chromosomal n=1 Tax=Tritonibacter horizontis TaxID=1768241 RepID=A0A132BZG6_9RHOB|nr:calcium-binding protein [Tritonibacter horizontis]KUP93749.1 hemolysin, chromosomal [Tritonibacter horizontis]
MGNSRSTWAGNKKKFQISAKTGFIFVKIVNTLETETGIDFLDLTDYFSNPNLVSRTDTKIVISGTGGFIAEYSGKNLSLSSWLWSIESIEYRRYGDTVFTLDGFDLSWSTISSGNLFNLQSMSGNDYVFSDYSGGDRWNLYGGNDTIELGAGDDTVDGGSGSDRLYGSDGDDSLIGSRGQDHLYGRDGDDQLFGSAGRDKLWGGDGQDQLDGGANNDLLIGKLGQDTLNGGSRIDTLIGDRGTDALTGGRGADVFVFDGQSDRDRVYDFKVGTDRVELRGDFSFSDLDFNDVRRGTWVEFQDSRILFYDVEAADLQDTDNFLF